MAAREEGSDFVQWVSSLDMQTFVADAFDVWEDHVAECEDCAGLNVQDETREVVRTLLEGAEPYELAILIMTFSKIKRMYDTDIRELKKRFNAWIAQSDIAAKIDQSVQAFMHDLGLEV